MRLLQVKRQGGRRQLQSRGNRPGIQPFGTGFDQQAVHTQPVFVGQRRQRINRLLRVHDLRPYFDYSRNIE